MIERLTTARLSHRNLITPDVFCGILLLDKPLGLSSSGATQRVRHLLGKVRAGHIGSLDPLATGMLPICLGEATKIAGVVLDGRKCYRFTVALGARSATGDAEGEIVERAAVPAMTPDRVSEALRGFLGVQWQVPPMYSAIKKHGQPLYKLARAGVTVERARRSIQIHAFDCLAIKADASGATSLDCRVICGKGTYVRTLAEDLCAALGTVGHVAALRREWVEPFDAGAMLSLDVLEAGLAAGRAPALVAVGEALPGLVRVVLDDSAAARLRLGQGVAINDPVAGLVLVLDGQGRVLGLGDADGAGQLRPKRLFVEPL